MNATEPGTTPEPAGKQPAQTTAYTVLRAERETVEGGADQTIYRIVAEVSAQGAAAARQSAFAKLPIAGQQAGATLIAVPSRSWQPKRRELVTQPRSVES
jgi:hypothetical protein